MRPSGWVILLCSTALGSVAEAFNFSLSPTVLEIDPARRTTAETRLVNVENVPLTFSAEVMKWENLNGQDVYTPTRDVLVNPTRFTLTPLGKQVIRVGLLKKVEGQELTYRLFLRQQPDAAPGSDAASGADGDGAAASMKTLLNISLPIYGAPASAAPKLQYTATPQGQDMQLNVQDVGNRHFTYRQLSIVSDTGKTFTLVSKAVLAGSSLELTLPGFADAKMLKFTSYDAQGQPINEQLTLP